MHQKGKRGRPAIENRDDVKDVRLDMTVSVNDLKKFNATRENKEPLYRAIRRAIEAKKPPKNE